MLPVVIIVVVALTGTFLIVKSRAAAPASTANKCTKEGGNNTGRWLLLLGARHPAERGCCWSASYDVRDCSESRQLKIFTPILRYMLQLVERAISRIALKYPP